MYRRCSGLTPVRAIVKLVHLNMNKTFSSGLRAYATRRNTAARHWRIIQPESQRRLGSQPNSGSVLRTRIYGLFNDGRLQIRRAINQPSNRPHRACTHGGHCSWPTSWWLRPIKYWVHALPRSRRDRPAYHRSRTFFAKRKASLARISIDEAGRIKYALGQEK